VDLEADHCGLVRHDRAFCLHVFEIADRLASVVSAVPAIVPWLLSFLNGMTILGFLFGRLNRVLPGRTGATKGLTFGLIGWVMLGLIFFPVIGLGPFAIGVGLGIGPAMLSLAMVLTYSIVLGTVYIALDAWSMDGADAAMPVQGRDRQNSDRA
jgi:Family of unknown function (DUF6789)